MVLAVEKPNKIQYLISSESNEWYTPEWVFDLVRQLGTIGLDPASNDIAQQWIRADKYYTIDDDGMSLCWATPGGLWLNPPYGTKGNGNHGASEWILEAIRCYCQGDFPWAVLLVKGDSKGVKELERCAVSCEPFQRISFVSPFDPTKNNPVPGCRFWYLGSETQRFAEVFGTIGAIRAPYKIGALK